MRECVRAGSVAGAFACASAGTHTGFLDATALERLSRADTGSTVP
ncbi:hypothetical protein [Nocardiopsis sp. CNR-923]|nr:hypothetical protein [Nocardiopsis sp. CNR-923]